MARPAGSAPPTSECRGTRGRLHVNLGLLVLSLVLCVVVLEIVVRLLSPPSPFSPFLPLRPHERIALRTNMAGVSPTGWNTTNKWGFRGSEPPADWTGTYTIVTIGGSTTQCFYLDDRKTWPAVLERRLTRPDRPVWVGNGGLDGQSTRAHVLFMETAIDEIRPNAVVVLTGINDLVLSVERDWLEYGNQYDRTSFLYRLVGASRLLQLGWAWKKVALDHAKVVHARRPLQFQAEPLPPGGGLKLPADPRTLLPQLPEFRANVRKIIRLGREQHVRVIFATQPMLFADTDEWRDVKGTLYWIREARGAMSAAAYWRLLDVYNRELLAICRAEGVECCDLASEIPHEWRYFYDAVHFNDAGAALVAEKLAACLGPSPPLHTTSRSR